MRHVRPCATLRIPRESLSIVTVVPDNRGFAWAAPWVTHPSLGAVLLVVVLILLVLLTGTIRSHRRIVARDTQDRMRAEQSRSHQIEQNVWLRGLSTALSRAISQPDVAAVLVEQGATVTGSSTATIALRQPGGASVTLMSAKSTTHNTPTHNTPTHGTPAASVSIPLEYPTPVTETIRHGKTVLIASAGELAARYPQLVDDRVRNGTVASASIPMLDSDGEVIGAVEFGWSSPQSFDVDQLVIFETATELCARALDRARLYELEYEARRLAENLQSFTTALAGTESRADVAEALVHGSMKGFGADAASVSVSTDDSLQMLVGRGFDEPTMDKWRTFPASLVSPASDALRTRLTILLESQADIIAAYPNLQSNVERTGAQTWLALPLVLGSEAPAVLFAVFRSPRSFSSQDRSLISTMGLQAALAFERARLRENDLAEAEKARQLAAAIGGLTAAATKDAVSSAFIKALPALGAQAGALGLISDDGSTLDFHDDGNHSAFYETQWQTRPIGARTPLVIAARTGESVFVSDRDELVDRFDAAGVEKVSDTHRSWAALPLQAGGRSLGALGLSFDARQRFDAGQRVKLASFAALCANALARAARFELEHSIAITLQSTLLPKQLKVLAGVKLSAQYSPGTAELSVGGDWYDVIELSEGRFLLVVGDVVGHGIESAAAMGKLATATRALAQVEDAPAALLRQLDRVAAADPTTQFASMAIVLVDRQAGEVRYSLAGHPAPLLRREDGSIESLDTARSIPLGGLTAERPELTVPFDGVITLLLYTDGLTERRTDHIDDRIRLLQSNFRDTDADINALPRTMIRLMMNGGVQHDDIAVLCASFTRSVPAYLRTIPAHTNQLAGLRVELRKWLLAASVGPDDTDDILVAVGEALTNAIEHGHGHDGRPIDMRAEHKHNLHTFAIRDRGAWRYPPTNDGSRGRGLALIHKLMDDVSIERSESGTTITFTKAVEQDPTL